MSRERPILFSAPMVAAILAGQKSQTRRVVKPQPPSEAECRAAFTGYSLAPRVSRAIKAYSLNDYELLPKEPGEFDVEGAVGFVRDRCGKDSWACPYGTPGDRLHVVTILPIPRHELRYGAGDDGRIYRVDRMEPRPLRPRTTVGYQRVTLCNGPGAQTDHTVHELVCSAFYGPSPSPRHEVRHLDGDRSNNDPVNLDWGTREQNWSDRKSQARGIHEQHHNAKLSMAVAAAMRASGKTAWVLAREYGVSPKTAANVLAGRTWVHSTAAPPNMPRWASRITLEVTAVRIQRLQAITEEDARAEGVQRLAYDFGEAWGGAVTGDGGRVPMATARDAFQCLWDEINGERAPWASNPFCWVVSFRRREG